jgi:hypothetical protein
MRVFLLSLFFSVAMPQSLSVISEIDTTEGFIGDVFSWSVKVDGQKDQSIRFPELGEINDTISIRNQSLIHENGKLTGIQFELMAWDTGSFSTPEYQVDIMNDDGSRNYSLTVEKLYFKVHSILATADAEDFRPIKGPVPVKGVFPTRLVVLGTLFILILGGMIWTWRQRQEVQYQKVDYANIETPEERAQRRLRDLDLNGLSKEYYADLSHISREYIETKYFIRALEMTTEEIQEFRPLFPLDDEQFSEWHQFLSEADMVKYARDIPTPDKMNSDMEKISSLISQI